MKKIVILVDQLHSHGGIEKLVALKANYWATVFGYDITILSTEQENQPIIYELSDKVKFVDLKINYNRNKSYFSIENLFKFLKNSWLIQNHLFQNKPDFVLVASHIPATYLVPFLITKAKTIKEFHFSKFSRNNIGIKNKVLTFIESKYDYLAVLSNEERQFYFSNNVVVIPNPIEKEVSFSLKPINERSNFAVSILRFAPVKRLEKMVEIWADFCKNNKSWKLHIFGTIGNEYYQSIFELVKNRNMQDFIIFKGQTDNVHRELAQSKLLLMTSEQECFPMVILEAQQIGVPVISFDCPTGPRNIIHNNEDGVLIENNNNDAFVAKLNEVVVDSPKLDLMSKKAQLNASQYSLDAIMNQWNDKIFMKS